VIVDTSALVAILRDEPDARRYAEAIAAASARRISAVTYVETAAVVDRGGDPIASRRVDELLDTSAISIEPVTVEQARIAREAYRDFGKGSGHPARLNLGDCFAYALAKATAERLLFKGDDFSRTDIAIALEQVGESAGDPSSAPGVPGHSEDPVAPDIRPSARAD
jgi:ribonuclease VapC